MSEKQKKSVMTQEENDRMINRLMLAFIIATCAVTLIMSLKNSFNTIRMYEVVAPTMTIACLVLFALSIVFFISRKRKGIDDSTKVITKYNVLGCGITALLCGAVYAVNPGIASVYSVILVIGICALYFIRYIYPFAFLALACFCLCEGLLVHAGFGLSTVRAFSSVLAVLFRIGTIVLPILFMVCVMLAKSKKKDLFSDIKPAALLICAAVALIGAVVLMLGSIGVFYVSYVYVLYAVAAVFLIIGVIQTVKSI